MTLGRALTTAIALSLAALGCGGEDDDGTPARHAYFTADFRMKIAPREIMGLGIFPLLLGEEVATELSFPALDHVFEDLDTDHLTLLSINSVGIRSTTDAADESTEALLDAERLTECRAGQNPMSWIRSVRMRIRKLDDNGEAVGEPATFAQFDIKQEDINRRGFCGFELTPIEGFNLVDYFPHARFTIDVIARMPLVDTRFGGFVSLHQEGSR